MADISLIHGAVVSMNHAMQIAKGIMSLHVSAEIAAKVSELQNLLITAQSNAIAAQSEQSTMIDEVRSLKEEVARIKAWEETKKRYKLKEIAPGIFSYSLKKDSEPTEPAHWICTKCYEEGVRSIIQKRTGNKYGATYICPRCSHEFRIHTVENPPSSAKIGRELNT